MKCPYCSAPNNHKIIESRATETHIRRRRQCLSCKRRFSTSEQVTDRTQVKLLRENRRAANQSFRLLAEQNATLWENQATMISLCRRILRALEADDSVAGELNLLLRPNTRRRRI